MTFNEALIYAGGICGATLISIISNNQAIFGAYHAGGKIRIAMCSLVYRKALRLSVATMNETASGKILNFMANDVNCFEFLSLVIQYLWSAPLVACIIGYFLYSEAGWPGLIGVAAVFFVVPFQGNHWYFKW